MKELLKKIPFLVKMKINMNINYSYYEDCKKFKKNWIESKDNINTIGYKIILDEHAIEKGLTSKNHRFFGIKKTENIINYLKIYEKNNWEKDFAYKLGFNILVSYADFYKKNSWTNREEYLKVKKFIESRKIDKLNAGCFELFKKDFISNSNIDYLKFLNSRHSVRNYEKERIKESDVIKAVNMALRTPTACNRQMCKIYYINDENIRSNALKYGHGLTNFEIDTVNMFIITFDISSLCCLGDRHQGWFNSGLVSMNFVNALHSLGIGSCFIQFGNDYKEENDMKKLIGIPDNEKIAVIISAGYYSEKSIVPYSSRKAINEIYKKI